MYRVILFILIFFCNIIFAEDNMSLMRRQFSGLPVSPELKSEVPFLQQNLSNTRSIHIPEINKYTLHFEPSPSTFGHFSLITGRSIFNAQFIVSWYIFDDIGKIPDSADEMIKLVNTQKPIVFKSLISINKKWTAYAELPHSGMMEDKYVFAYISYPNVQGVLVPIAGQSFYNENGNYIREKYLDLNNSILDYWQRKGFL